MAHSIPNVNVRSGGACNWSLKTVLRSAKYVAKVEHVVIPVHFKVVLQT